MFGETFFYIIGIYAFLWWFIDTFKSLFAIIWSVLMSYLTPELYPPLNEKFGNWAGEKSIVKRRKKYHIKMCLANVPQIGSNCIFFVIVKLCV